MRLQSHATKVGVGKNSHLARLEAINSYLTNEGKSDVSEFTSLEFLQ